MIGRRIFIGGTLISGPALLGACGFIAERYPTYRYRLTAEVDTPEGLRSGSSVIEVRTGNSGSWSIPSPNHMRRQVVGEAPMVQVSKDKVLFVLLQSDERPDWASIIFYLIQPQGLFSHGKATADEPRKEHRAEHQAMLKRKDLFDLPRNFLRSDNYQEPLFPILVMFRDESDPRSLERVDPDNLAKAFGEGVNLRRITLQLTDDPVTNEISKKLPWLDGLHKYRTDPENPFTNTLSKEIGALRNKVR